MLSVGFGFYYWAGKVRHADMLVGIHIIESFLFMSSFLAFLPHPWWTRHEASSELNLSWSVIFFPPHLFFHSAQFIFSGLSFSFSFLFYAILLSLSSVSREHILPDVLFVFKHNGVGSFRGEIGVLKLTDTWGSHFILPCISKCRGHGGSVG